MKDWLDDFWEDFCIPLIGAVIWIVTFCILIGAATLIAKWVWESV